MVVSTKTVGIWVLTLTYFSLVYITFIMGICKKRCNKSQIKKNTYVIETEAKFRSYILKSVLISRLVE